jgi:ABC-type transport system involved in multi-copper enzyme maturation permease subunit
MKILDTSPPIRRLYWKEARTLLPLLILLSALAVVFHIGGLFESSSGRFQEINNMGIHYLVFIGLPMLFAVGAGAITIGQEKELRTIQWLASLPIAPKDLIRVKLVSCFLGLLAAWFLSGLILLTVGLVDSRALALSLQWQDESKLLFFTWPLHSFYLLLSGIAISWYSRSSLSGLVLLIPIALVPGFAGEVFEVVLYRRFDSGVVTSFAKFLVISTTQIGLCLTAYWLSWRLAAHILSPQVIKPSKLNVFSNFAFRSFLARSKTWQSRANLPPASALVWQSFRQNRKFLLWTAFVIVATFGFLVINAVNGWVNNLGIAGVLPLLLSAFLGSSWIGVLTFQSDRMHRRIGFLSHRGVSATLTWWTRQMVPMSVLCVVILVCYGLFYANRDAPELNQLSNPFTVLTLAAFLFSSYIIAQWVGQIFTASIVAVVVSPAVAAATFYYFLFAWQTLSAPLWLLALCLLVPLLATWTAMSRWMDARLDKVFWSTHVCFLLAFLLIPVIPLAATILTLPRGMSPEVTKELANEAAQHQGYDLLDNEKQLTVFTPRPTNVGVKLDPTETFASLQQQALSTLEKQVRAKTGPLLIEFHTMDYLHAETTLCIDRILKGLGGEIDAKTEEAGTETKEVLYYRALLKLASDIVVRVRLSHLIRQQDLCDVIEIWLLREMRRAKDNPVAMKIVGDSLYATIAQRLANSKDRNTARKRAVALSWKESQLPIRNARRQPDNVPRIALGQYVIDRAYDYDPSWLNLIVRRQKLSALASELWMIAKEGATAGNRLERDSRSESSFASHWNRIASIVDVPVQFYGIVPRGDFLRADDVNRFVFETASSQRQAPASQWFAGWEREAESLVIKELP